MKSCRITAGRVAELEQQLSPRERAVIDTLDRVRLATTAQLQRLHVTDGSRASNMRRTQATLTRLIEVRALARLNRRVGGVRSGSAGFVYALDVAGQRLASVCGPAGGRRTRRPWTPGAAFVAHAVAVTELYVQLRESERAGSWELLDFDAEPLCWRTFASIGGGRTVLKPDAYFRLAVGHFEDSYFLELDRATQSGPAIARKLRTYQRFHDTGHEQERRGVFPRVLFLVPSEARKTALVDLAANQPPESWPLFAVALASVARTYLTGAPR